MQAFSRCCKDSASTKLWSTRLRVDEAFVDTERFVGSPTDCVPFVGALGGLEDPGDEPGGVVVVALLLLFLLLLLLSLSLSLSLALARINKDK